MDDVLHTDKLLREKSGLIHGFLSSLYFRNYRQLWLGNMLTSGSHWMEIVAAGWLMLDLTASPFLVGLVAFCRGIPMLLAAPAGGVLADRLDRRRFIMLCQGVLALGVLTLGTLVLFRWVAPWHVLLAGLVSGTAFALLFPARQALIPALVSPKHLPNAVALYSIATNLMRVLGPSLAGALIGLLGIAVCFFLETVAYLSALWTTSVMRTPSNTGQSGADTVWQNLWAGLSYVRNEKRIFALLLLVAATCLFGMPYLSMLPVLARIEYQVDATGLGIMTASMGVGALVGSLLLAGWKNLPRRGAVALVTALVFSFAIVGLSLASSFYVACAALFVTGLSNAFNMAIANTLIHQLTPDALRGRVMSGYVMTFGLQPLGSLAVGAVAELSGAPLAIGLGGALSAVAVVVIAVAVPELRRLE